MDIQEKLQSLKELENPIAAIDTAYIMGVQSVVPMREFTIAELRVLYDCVYKTEQDHGQYDGTVASDTRRDLAGRLFAEINRRDELLAPLKERIARIKTYTARKEAAKNAKDFDALEEAH